MPRPERDFKGVWIPKEIWLSRQLSLMEKVLFVEINSLDNVRGCYAKNRQFADFFGVSERQIRTYIGNLKEHGFIDVTIQNNNDRVMRVVERIVRCPEDELVVSSEPRTVMEHKPRPERDFKGIWIPKEIWLSTQLTIMEKVLFVEIHSLDNEKGCVASNRYFAGFFAVSERQIRTYIGTLKKKGFVYVTVQNMFERSIRVVGKYARVRAEDMQNLKNARHELIHSMSLSVVGGRKKTARGVGSNV